LTSPRENKKVEEKLTSPREEKKDEVKPEVIKGDTSFKTEIKSYSSFSDLKNKFKNIEIDKEKEKEKKEEFEKEKEKKKLMSPRDKKDKEKEIIVEQYNSNSPRDKEIQDLKKKIEQSLLERKKLEDSIQEIKVVLHNFE
jgi:hypothetical protein